MARILSIEDDPSIQQVLSVALNLEGHEVHYAFSGDEGFKKIFTSRPDMVILDLMLPGMSGAEVLKALHGHPELKGTPVLVMTAFGGGQRGSVLEQTVKALGAVEYLEKPFRIPELLRRVKACLAARPKESAPGREIRSGEMRLDTRLRTVLVNDRLVATLPPSRFELLAALASADGPLAKEELLTRVWRGRAGPAALEKAISRLREDLGDQAFRLKTTPGGYEFVARADIS
ncbi:MAG: response regulator transcription factor [Elusimicrobia bacterium]|nr:response regulator transcription factor [Elusimicrobiota bacterium]